MDLHSMLIVAVVAAVTIFLRVLPFLLFGGKKKTPEFIIYLGRVLPYAIMGMLVVYCLRGMVGGSIQSAAVQLMACTIVILLHLWKRNTLISIIGGTIGYMLLLKLI